MFGERRFRERKNWDVAGDFLRFLGAQSFYFIQLLFHFCIFVFFCFFKFLMLLQV